MGGHGPRGRHWRYLTVPAKPGSSRPRKRTATPEVVTPGAPLPAWISTLAALTDSALRIAGAGRDVALRAATPSPEQLRLMAMAGESLRDVREVAGLTVADVSRALDLRDKNVWEAIEAGREVLSVELILRVTSLLARNDPLPFILRMARSYQPRLWSTLQQLGVDGLPLQLEREREFINILRRHDAARALPDDDWTRVLDFTRHAFELGLGAVTRTRKEPPRKARRARTTRRPAP